MTVEAFLDNYVEKKKKSCIPGISINKPIAKANGLGDVGLELEIEARDLPSEGECANVVAPRSGAVWRAHPDGSLRGENLEYVLSVPAYIDEVPALIAGLWEKFRTKKTVFNLSNRCSTHVHVNMGGLKINQLTSVIALWTSFEEVLINWCGEERKTNHFCLSSKDSNAIIERWCLFLSTGRFEYSEGFKYTALNIRPIRGQGSFEFRCGPASKDPATILDWTKFIHSLCRFAYTNYTNPQVMASDFSEIGGLEIFRRIALEGGVSNKFIYDILEDKANGHFHETVIEGFRRAQPLVMGFPWYNWMPEIEKEYVPNPFDKVESFPVMPRFRVEDLPGHPGIPDPGRLEVRRRLQGMRETRARQVNPGEGPYYFPDGTEAIISSFMEETFRARAVETLMSPNGRENLANEYSYERETGYWSGNAAIGQVMTAAGYAEYLDDVENIAMEAFDVEEDEDREED